jgi:Cu2+-exporting ATPase
MHLPESIAAADTPATARSQAARCFHCSLPVPAGTGYHTRILGEDRPMCCPGCQAVARAIVDSGNADFYRHRTEASTTGREVVPEFIEQARVYDHPTVQKSFVHEEAGNLREAALILEGITCAACIWLNERHIGQLPGVHDVQINYATRRAQVRWDPSRVRLSDILLAIRAIGYQASPYDPEKQQQAFERERHAHLRRLGVAAVLAMQVMILSVALYAGDWSGMDAGFRHFFRWLALLLTTPVLAYSAAPFLRGAWRDLRNRSIGMDVPVSLGILVAFGGSLHATWSGRGAVYYDSVVMFVFFLLLSRYFEIMARKRGAELSERLNQALPAVATRLVGEQGAQRQEMVPVIELGPGDRVLVKPGAVVPADGTLESAACAVNEALLTGESTPLPKARGDTLVGGSLNTDTPITLRVTHVGQETVLAQILRLLERAQGEKPALTRLADRTAAWFVGAVLLVAVVVGLYWWQAGADWLPILVSVLVVTCPCALSLATPTALSAATGSMLAAGLLAARGNRLETLARSTHVVFDKTGTLTLGTPALAMVRPLSGLGAQQVLEIAAALESRSEHPLGRAILQAAGTAQAATVEEAVNYPGAGISGRVRGKRYYIGNARFIAAHCREVPASGEGSIGDTRPGTRIWLADDARCLARFLLHDSPRPDARTTVARLTQAGLQVVLMTGDNRASAAEVAGQAGIETLHAGMRPQDKLDEVQALQRAGAVVVMVGDGINDAPVLAAADVSVAMQGAAQISHASADLILMSDRLEALADGLGIARKTLAVIRQNLAWAIAYNLIALPVAALGYIAPWMAAVGMSASSLLVVLNALRLARNRRPRTAGRGSTAPATVAG